MLAEVDLSVVIPAFNEASNVRALCGRLTGVLESLGLRWEVVIVDDGSEDDTFSVVTELHAGEPRIHGLRLSRNFGHQLALLAGLRQAAGRAVVTMDADLQHPPELIPELVRAWEAKALVVHTVRDDSEARIPWRKAITSRLFYALFRSLSGLDLEPGMADFRLLDRQVVRTLTSGNDHRPFFRGLVVWAGYRQARVRYHPGERAHGTSRYSLRRMVSLAFGGIVGFSAKPLYLALGMGGLGLVGSLAYGAYSLFAHVFRGTTVPGWTSLVLLISFLMSLQFAILGVLGIYVGEIAAHIRGRPAVLVAESTFDVAPAMQAAAAAGDPPTVSGRRTRAGVRPTA